MKRTPLSQRQLPSYTRGEERFHMGSHIVGGGFGIVALVLGVLTAVHHRDVWAVTGAAVYGLSMIALYTMSAIYHGLPPGMGKRVMQVMDHCTIYLLIAGTYTPILLSAFRVDYPVWCWTLFGLVWGLAAAGAVFTAIDLKRYAKLSVACYLGMGWCIVLAVKPALDCVPLPALGWILAGGIAYTVGVLFYGLGKTRPYAHGVFHVFALLGSVLQFIGIAGYIL